jgi:hypothetical protein
MNQTPNTEQSQQLAMSPGNGSELYAPLVKSLIHSLQVLIAGQEGPCAWEVDPAKPGTLIIYDERRRKIGEVRSFNLK